MLRLTKHLHPNQTIISMSLLLLDKLKKDQVAQYDSLLMLAKNEIKGGNALLLPALNFLYLIGSIEYRPKTDTIEYIGPL